MTWQEVVNNLVSKSVSWIVIGWIITRFMGSVAAVIISKKR